LFRAHLITVAIVGTSLVLCEEAGRHNDLL